MSFTESRTLLNRGCKSGLKTSHENSPKIVEKTPFLTAPGKRHVTIDAGAPEIAKRIQGSSWHQLCFGGNAMESDLEPFRFITLREAAKILQVSTRTLHRMIERTEFPAFKVGGQWRVRKSEVAKWIQGLSEL